MNLKLPDMEGLSLIRWCKDRCPHIPIWIVTGYEDPRARSSIFDAGAIGIFPKPYTSTDNRAVLALLDMRTAMYRQMLTKPSWRTTVCGVITMSAGILAGVIALSGTDPEMTRIMLSIAASSAGFGLLMARDEKTARQLFESFTSKNSAALMAL